MAFCTGLPRNRTPALRRADPRSSVCFGSLASSWPARWPHTRDRQAATVEHQANTRRHRNGAQSHPRFSWRRQKDGSGRSPQGCEAPVGGCCKAPDSKDTWPRHRSRRYPRALHRRSAVRSKGRFRGFGLIARVAHLELRSREAESWWASNTGRKIKLMMVPGTDDLLRRRTSSREGFRRCPLRKPGRRCAPSQR